VVTLLRLSPLLPLALSNYFYGLTSVDLASYVAGSWLGMLPGTVLYVIAGKSSPPPRPGHVHGVLSAWGQGDFMLIYCDALARTKGARTRGGGGGGNPGTLSGMHETAASLEETCGDLCEAIVCRLRLQTPAIPCIGLLE